MEYKSEGKNPNNMINIYRDPEMNATIIIDTQYDDNDVKSAVVKKTIDNNTERLLVRDELTFDDTGDNEESHEITTYNYDDETGALSVATTYELDRSGFVKADSVKEYRDDSWSNMSTKYDVNHVPMETSQEICYQNRSRERLCQIYNKDGYVESEISEEYNPEDDILHVYSKKFDANKNLIESDNMYYRSDGTIDKGRHICYKTESNVKEGMKASSYGFDSVDSVDTYVKAFQEDNLDTLEGLLNHMAKRQVSSKSNNIENYYDIESRFVDNPHDSELSEVLKSRRDDVDNSYKCTCKKYHDSYGKTLVYVKDLEYNNEEGALITRQEIYDRWLNLCNESKTIVKEEDGVRISSRVEIAYDCSAENNVVTRRETLWESTFNSSDYSVENEVVTQAVYDDMGRVNTLSLDSKSSSSINNGYKLYGIEYDEDDGSVKNVEVKTYGDMVLPLRGNKDIPKHFNLYHFENGVSTPLVSVTADRIAPENLDKLELNVKRHADRESFVIKETVYQSKLDKAVSAFDSIGERDDTSNFYSAQIDDIF